MRPWVGAAERRLARRHGPADGGSADGSAGEDVASSAVNSGNGGGFVILERARARQLPATAPVGLVVGVYIAADLV